MRRIVTVSAVLSILGVPPSAAQDGGSVSGVVTDRATGGRLGGAVIRIVPAGRSVVTSADGRYRTASLSAGEYEVSVSLLGFEATTATVMIEGDVVHENFALVPEGGRAGAAPGDG